MYEKPAPRSLAVPDDVESTFETHGVLRGARIAVYLPRAAIPVTDWDPEVSSMAILAGKSHSRMADVDRLGQERETVLAKHLRGIFASVSGGRVLRREKRMERDTAILVIV